MCTCNTWPRELGAVRKAKQTYSSNPIYVIPRVVFKARSGCHQALEASGQAKKAIFPEDGPPVGTADTGVGPASVKCHGSCSAGGQIRRGYDWTSAKIDPNSHVFGACFIYISKFEALSLLTTVRHVESHDMKHMFCPRQVKSP
jgi:hypothetical protein